MRPFFVVRRGTVALSKRHGRILSLTALSDRDICGQSILNSRFGHLPLRKTGGGGGHIDPTGFCRRAALLVPRRGAACHAGG